MDLKEYIHDSLSMTKAELEEKYGKRPKGPETEEERDRDIITHMIPHKKLFLFTSIYISNSKYKDIDTAYFTYIHISKQIGIEAFDYRIFVDNIRNLEFCGFIKFRKRLDKLYISEISHKQSFSKILMEDPLFENISQEFKI